MHHPSNFFETEILPFSQIFFIKQFISPHWSRLEPKLARNFLRSGIDASFCCSVCLGKLFSKSKLFVSMLSKRKKELGRWPRINCKNHERRLWRTKTLGSHAPAVKTRQVVNIIFPHVMYFTNKICAGFVQVIFRLGVIHSSPYNLNSMKENKYLRHYIEAKSCKQITTRALKPVIFIGNKILPLR